MGNLSDLADLSLLAWFSKACFENLLVHTPLGSRTDEASHVKPVGRMPVFGRARLPKPCTSALHFKTGGSRLLARNGLAKPRNFLRKNGPQMGNMWMTGLMGLGVDERGRTMWLSAASRPPYIEAISLSLSICTAAPAAAAAPPAAAAAPPPLRFHVRIGMSICAGVLGTE